MSIHLSLALVRALDKDMEDEVYHHVSVLTLASFENLRTKAWIKNLARDKVIEPHHLLGYFKLQRIVYLLATSLDPADAVPPIPEMVKQFGFDAPSFRGYLVQRASFYDDCVAKFGS